MTKEFAEKAPLCANWDAEQPPNSTQQKFLSKKGVYRHLSAYASDNQRITGDGKVTVTCIFGK